MGAETISKLFVRLRLTDILPLPNGKGDKNPLTGLGLYALCPWLDNKYVRMVERGSRLCSQQSLLTWLHRPSATFCFPETNAGPNIIAFLEVSATPGFKSPNSELTIVELAVQIKHGAFAADVEAAAASVVFENRFPKCTVYSHPAIQCPTGILSKSIL